MNKSKSQKTLIQNDPIDKLNINIINGNNWGKNT